MIIDLNTYDGLKNWIKNNSNNKHIVHGLEGCAKSVSMLHYALNDMCSVDKIENDCIVLYACQSYKQLKEKQSYLIEQYNGNDKMFPIIGTDNSANNEIYRTFLTNVNNPLEIYTESKIVLCSTSFIKQKCFEYNKPISDRLVGIIIDEFDWTSTIVPSIEYLTTEFVSKNIGDISKISKKEFESFLRTKWSNDDVRNLKNSGTFKPDFQLASWLNRFTSYKSIYQLFFLSSETLAVDILKSTGFIDYKIKSNLDFSKFIISTATIDINTKVLEKISDTNKWNIFDYDRIIADKYTEICKVINRDEISVDNHATAKGSNSYLSHDGLSVLSIITAVPNTAIKQIRDVLCYFNGNNDYITFKEVCSKFYLDRIRQSIGRNTGHRYINGSSTILLISSYIYEEIIKTDVINHINFPYDLHLPEEKELDINLSKINWDELNIIINQVNEIKEVNKEKSIHKLEVEKQYIIKELFDYGTKDDRISCKQIKDIIKKYNSFVEIQATDVAFLFECKYITYKKTRMLSGIKLSSKAKELL